MNEFVLGKTHYKRFTSRQFSSGQPFTLAGTPVISAYEDASTTELTAGIAIGVDHDARTGLNLLTLTLTAANGYEYGKDYDLVVTAGTVDGVSVVGEVVDSFRMLTKDEISAKFHLGPIGPGIYVNFGGSNTNTQVGVDGTAANPVSSFAAAKTLADELGLKVIYCTDPAGPSIENVLATMNHYVFWGIGDRTNKIIDFNGQNVGDSLFYNVTVQGPMGAGNRATLDHCTIQEEIGPGVTTLHAACYACGFEDEATFDTSSDNTMDQCYSLVAGTAAVIIRASGAAGALNIRHHSGGIDFRDLSASHTVSVEGMGQIIFDASCNVNAAVAIRGLFDLTDNTAGMNSVSQDARLTRTEIADALLNRDMSAVNDTNARSPLNAMRFMRNKWSITGATLTVTKEDDATTAWTATLSTDAAANPVVGNDPA